MIDPNAADQQVGVLDAGIMGVLFGVDPFKVQGQQQQKQQQQTIQVGNAFPFPKQYLGDISLDFHQQWGSETEPGIDYAMPVGVPLVAPAGGTVQVIDEGKKNWGKRLLLKMPDGRTFGIGHMSRFSVQSGQQIQPGQLLGYSGGDPADASSGQSSGPHIEVQMLDQGGNFINPHPYMQQLESGQYQQSNQQVAQSQLGGDPFQQWASAVLQGIGAPVSANNLNIMYTWGKFESGNSLMRWNNPLNTTQGAAGASDMNSVGVKSYGDMQTGIQATIQTLMNGYYPNIVAGLKQDTNPTMLAAMADHEFGTWGTGSGFLHNMQNYPGAVPNAPAAGGGPNLSPMQQADVAQAVDPLRSHANQRVMQTRGFFGGF